LRCLVLLAGQMGITQKNQTKVPEAVFIYSDRSLRRQTVERVLPIYRQPLQHKFVWSKGDEDLPLEFDYREFDLSFASMFDGTPIYVVKGLEIQRATISLEISRVEELAGRMNVKNYLYSQLAETVRNTDRDAAFLDFKQTTEQQLERDFTRHTLSAVVVIQEGALVDSH